MPQMIIASRLLDGLVVFFDSDGGWVASIDDGALLEDDEESTRVLALAREQEARCVVVDPYLIEVIVEDGRRRPAAIREAIRAFGPSVRTETMN